MGFGIFCKVFSPLCPLSTPILFSNIKYQVVETPLGQSVNNRNEEIRRKQLVETPLGQSVNKRNEEIRRKQLVETPLGQSINNRNEENNRCLWLLLKFAQDLYLFQLKSLALGKKMNNFVKVYKPCEAEKLKEGGIPQSRVSSRPC